MQRRASLRNCLLACLLVGLLVAGRPVAAQTTSVNWQPLAGPAGRLTHLAAAPDGKTLYAVAAGVVNRRDDDETQWFDRYRLSYAEALYRSTDGGATWQPATNDLPPGMITALAVDPVNNDVLIGLVASGDTFTRRSGLWRSSDGGANWQQVPLGRDDLIVRAISRDKEGKTLFLGAITAGKYPDSYVYRFVDGAWRASQALRYEQRPGSILVALLASPADPDRLYLLTAGGDLFVSPDAGESWALAPRPAETVPTAAPAVLAWRPEVTSSLLLVREGASGEPPAVYRSSDGGTSWRRLDATGLPANVRVNTLAALAGGIYLLSTSGGTYRSSDQGLTWVLLEGPLGSGNVTDFVVLPGPSGRAGTTVLAATGHGLFISRDQGALWQPHGSGLPFNSKIAGLLTHPERPGLVFAISDNRFADLSAAPPLLFRSVDGGANWAPASQGLPTMQITAWATDPTDPHTLYLATWEHFYRSTDAGVSWQVSRLQFDRHTALAVASAQPSVLYLGGRPALRSTDGGATWQAIPVRTAGETGQRQDVVGLAVDTKDAGHVWAALSDGVFESRDGGQSWQAAGLSGRELLWLAQARTPAADEAGEAPTLYAGVRDDGIYRLRPGGDWTPINTGLPANSTILAFVADPRSPGLLWAARDGGGVYRSTDDGETWRNVAVGMGDNLVQALAPDFSAPDGVFAGTATAGVWTAGSTRPATPAPAPAAGRSGADARIEIVWPHNWAPPQEARLANIGLRLFLPGSLLQPACGWRPKVTVWQAADTAPAAPLATAEQRSVDGQPFPYWVLNDVDVSQAMDPSRKLYFMVRVEGVDTATSIWAHGTDPRTYLPQPEVPSGIATDAITAVDARIQIVWPHDEAGNERPVTEAALANVSVTLFKHGTRLSVPMTWRPAGIVLYGAWNQEVSRPLARQAQVIARQSGAITYPTWEFNNIPVARASDPWNKLYLWVAVEGVQTYPSIWSHGADARTFFPFKDEPIQGCVP